MVLRAGSGALLRIRIRFLPLFEAMSANFISTLCLCVFVQFVLQQVDISLPENSIWFNRYRWDIPVFHLNGQFVMKHRVDVMLLDKLLQDAETQAT